MYAYSLAAADIQMPHEVVDSMMISCLDCYGEGEHHTSICLV